jgi:hypothetical protein
MSKNNIPLLATVASGINKDGRIELFMTGLDGTIYHMWQIAANWQWKDQFKKLGEGHYASNALVVISNDSGTLEVFYIGTNFNLYHNWQKSPGGSWNGEVQIGHSDKSNDISVAKNADGQAQLFGCARDTGELFYHTRNKNGSWQGKKQLVPANAIGCLVILDPTGRLQLVFLDVNFTLFSVSQEVSNQTDGWTAPARIGLDVLDMVMGCLPGRNGTICVFFDDVGGLWSILLPFNSNTWGIPQQLSFKAFPNKLAGLALAVNFTGWFVLFLFDETGAIFRMVQTGPENWGDVEPMNEFGSSITAIPNQDGHLELIYVGPESLLCHDWQELGTDNWNGGVPY